MTVRVGGALGSGAASVVIVNEDVELADAVGNPNAMHPAGA